MSQTTYQTLSAEELAVMHDETWRSALAGLDVPHLNDGEDGEVLHPATLVMPYFAAFRMYERHVARCTVCVETPVWDIGCEEGAALAHMSADAMAAQEDLAGQN